MTGKRVEAFVTAKRFPLPKAMLDTFFFLDNFFGKMEYEKMEKEANKKS